MVHGNDMHLQQLIACRFKRESWVRKMQDTYSDCITTTNQCYGYFLTSQDYMDWGRDMRNQKERIEANLMITKPADSKTKKSEYPRKFVPYVSKNGYVGVWEAHKCLNHKAEEHSEPYETQAVVKEVYTPRKQLPLPRPPALKSRKSTSSSTRLHREKEVLQQIIAEKSIKLPDIKMHPLASKEESQRRGLRTSASTSCHAAVFGTSFQHPWKHSGLVRGV